MDEITLPPIPGVTPEAQRKVEIMLDRVAAGETITSICADPEMLGLNWFFRVLNAAGGRDSEAWQAYRQARETAGHVLASRVLDEAYTVGDPMLQKLRVDALKWTAGKFNGSYSDSTQIRHADANGNKLDTQPMVQEFLALLQPSGRNAEITDRVTYRDVTGKQPATPPQVAQARALEPPAPQHAAPPVPPGPPARPVYRPRARAPSDASDLV